MNIYEKKQLEFEIEQLLTYVTMSTIDVYQKWQLSTHAEVLACN